MSESTQITTDSLQSQEQPDNNDSKSLARDTMFGSTSTTAKVVPVNMIQEKRMRAALAQKGVAPLNPNSQNVELSQEDNGEDAFNFVGKIEEWRSANSQRLTKPHVVYDEKTETPNPKNNIIVCVRKRPVLSSLGEVVSNANYDAITCLNPSTYLHGKQERLGLYTGKLKAEKKTFDHTFGMADDNNTVYATVVSPLVQATLNGATCMYNNPDDNSCTSPRYFRYVCVYVNGLQVQ